MIEKAKNNCEKINNSEYQGRAIIMGLTPSGNEFIQLYWTMGRSDNSKNRILKRQDGYIKTVLKCNTGNMVNDNLLLYNIAHQLDDVHIVSNGEQTDTIVKSISEGKGLEDALSQWNHEYDAPIFTPRISGLVNINHLKNQYSFQLGINKPLEGNTQLSSHHIFTYSQCLPGFAYCIHTYQLDKVCNPFIGEPYLVITFDDIDEMASYYWNLISSDNKIGMYIKFINIENGNVKDRIINRDDEI